MDTSAGPLCPAINGVPIPVPAIEDGRSGSPTVPVRGAPPLPTIRATAWKDPKNAAAEKLLVVELASGTLREIAQQLLHYSELMPPDGEVDPEDLIYLSKQLKLISESLVLGASEGDVQRLVALPRLRRFCSSQGFPWAPMHLTLS